MELRPRWTDAEVEEIVEEWHTSPCLADFSLHGLLGFTYDEYAHWVRTNEVPFENFEQLRLF